MDLCLHIGAHRTARGTFQNYLTCNAEALAHLGIAICSPGMTHNSLLKVETPKNYKEPRNDRLSRSEARVALNLARASDIGADWLVVSDTAFIGPIGTTQTNSLYADIGQRMARFCAAFDHKVRRIALNIRSYESFWASLLSAEIENGRAPLKTGDLEKLVQSSRRWRDVITDLACAMPGTEIQVMPFEEYAGMPERALEQMTNTTDLPRNYAREWLNRAPSLEYLRKIMEERGDNPERLPFDSGRWQPFDKAQQSQLREAYADDLYWLRSGADGHAVLKENKRTVRLRGSVATGRTDRGRRRNGIEDRHLA
ncbi:MAG: hypothetical protein AAGF53_00235 [Pseudomonadota bacterium]